MDTTYSQDTASPQPSTDDQRVLAELIRSDDPITIEELERRGVADAEALMEWAEDRGLVLLAELEEGV